MTNQEIIDEVIKLGEQLDCALQSDGEHGVRWLNEEHAREFNLKNPALVEWMKRFQDFAIKVELEHGHT